jgi:hypothetical protein
MVSGPTVPRVDVVAPGSPSSVLPGSVVRTHTALIQPHTFNPPTTQSEVSTRQSLSTEQGAREVVSVGDTAEDVVSTPPRAGPVPALVVSAVGSGAPGSGWHSKSKQIQIESAQSPPVTPKQSASTLQGTRSFVSTGRSLVVDAWLSPDPVPLATVLVDWP